jgi:hypothetical protein
VRSRRRILAPLAAVGFAWLVAALGGCTDQDCVRGLYSITEMRATPAGSVCGRVQPLPATGVPHACDPFACFSICPRLQLTDGTSIAPSRCTQIAVASTAGSGGGGRGATGGSGGVGGSGGMGGAPLAATGLLECVYDLDVDRCTSRSKARGER